MSRPPDRDLYYPDDPGFVERGPDAPTRAGVARSMALFTLAAAIVGGFGYLAWYAYTSSVGDHAPPPDDALAPLIAAPAGPLKEPPEDPGGAEIAGIDYQVYETIDPNAARPDEAEQLLPPPETPILPDRAALEAPLPPPMPIELPPFPPPPSPIAPDDGAGDAPEATPEAIIDPVIIQPVAPLPAVPSPPALDQPAPAPEATAAVAAEESPPSGDPIADIITRLDTDRGVVATPAPEPASEPAPIADSASPVVEDVVATAPTGVRIQLASVRSRADADSEWRRMTARYPDLLGALEKIVDSADLGDRGLYFRLQAGYLDTDAAAVALCARLKAAGQDCFVVNR